MNLPTTLTGITIIGSTLHWDIYPQLNIVKIPLKKLFSLVLTIQQGAYQDAIRILNLGIKYCDTELDKALMKFLLGDIYYCLGEYNKVHIYYEECKILLLKESSLYNKKTIIKKLINLYAKQKDITAIENLLKEIDTISDRIQKKELINECKIEIYRLLVRREIELSDYIEQYITKT